MNPGPRQLFRGLGSFFPAEAQELMITASVSPTASSALVAFDYHPLTKVVFGTGTLARLGELARELGASRVLLVTDRGLEAAGHPQNALASLQSAGVEVFTFDEVEQNPTTC